VNAPHRIFIDSNVLFSTSRRDAHRFLRFWQYPLAHAVVSSYIVEETARHVVLGSHLRRLRELLSRTEIIEGDDRALPAEIQLAEKDRPIFAHALVARARFLVTGDKHHFGRYFNQTFEMPYGPLTVIEPAALVFYLEALE